MEKLTAICMSGLNAQSAKLMFKSSNLFIASILLCSCSATINLTAAQKEQKKLDRFSVTPKQVAIFSATAFVGYGLGKHISNQPKDK